MTLAYNATYSYTNRVAHKGDSVKWFGVPHRLVEFVVHSELDWGVPAYDAAGRIVALFDYMAQRPEYRDGVLPKDAVVGQAVGLSGARLQRFCKVLRAVFEAEDGRLTAYVNANAALNKRRALQARKQRERRAGAGDA